MKNTNIVGVRKNILLSGVAFLLMGASGAFAQTSVPAQADNNAQLDEIVITAQKRPETLRTVPISATVVSGETLQSEGIATLRGIAEITPAVHISNGGVSDDLYIRGIGSGPNPSFDQSVGTFIDDIYHGRSKLSEGNFLDVERVEILKGPQSIYFGNNAIAGALNIKTKQPGFEYEGYARALGSPSDESYTLEAALTTPISDKFSVRTAFSVAGGNGFLHDIGAQSNAPNEDNKIGRVSAIWRPSDDFSAIFKAELSSQRESGTRHELVDCPPPPGFPAPGRFCQVAIAAHAPTGLGDTEDTVPGQRHSLRTQEYVATLNYSLGENTITSVTGYTQYYFQSQGGVSGTPTQQLNVTLPEKDRQFSEELRFVSEKGKTIEYIAGLYYQPSQLAGTEVLEYGFLSPTIAGIPPFAPLAPYLPLGRGAYHSDRVTNYSAFGAVTWNITPMLRITAGLRESIVRDAFSQYLSFGTADLPFGNVNPFPASLVALGNSAGATLGLGGVGSTNLIRTDRHLSPSANIQFDVTDDIMAYVSYANGFKAGGFNGIEFSHIIDRYGFGPETVDAYEAGIKSRLFDKSVTLNLDIFRSEYSQLQEAVTLNTGNLYVNLIRNVGGSVSQGLEFDGQWAVDRHWKIGINATYLDAHYTDFPDAGPTPLQTLQGLKFQNLTGKPTEFAPDFSGSLDIQYATPIMYGLELRADANLFLSDKINLSANNDSFEQQGGYGKLGATLTIADGDGKWDVSVIGKNLTNTKIINWATSVAATPGSYLEEKEQPRSVAVEAKIRW